MAHKTPTRWPNGFGYGAPGKFNYELQMPDPSRFHVFFDDFDDYVAANWTVTETQAGATQALADGDGGTILLTNSAADNDLVSLQKVGESFRWETGQPIFGKTRFKASDATDSDIAIGLIITDTSPIASAPSDAIYFLKADDAATIDFKVGKNSTYSTKSALATLVADTFITLGFFCDGKARVEGGLTYYDFDIFAGTGQNPDKVATLAVLSTNMPDDEDLTVTFAIQNGAAAAKTLTVDYVMFGKARW